MLLYSCLFVLEVREGGVSQDLPVNKSVCHCHFPSVCLHLYLLLSVCLCWCPFFGFRLSLSVTLCLRLSVSVSVSLSIHLSDHLSLSVSLSFCLLSPPSIPLRHPSLLSSHLAGQDRSPEAHAVLCLFIWS